MGQWTGSFLLMNRTEDRNLNLRFFQRFNVGYFSLELTQGPAVALLVLLAELLQLFLGATDCCCFC